MIVAQKEIINPIKVLGETLLAYYEIRFATDGPETLAIAKGVFWSNINDFNALLDHVGLRKLPEL